MPLPAFSLSRLNSTYRGHLGIVTCQHLPIISQVSVFSYHVSFTMNQVPAGLLHAQPKHFRRIRFAFLHRLLPRSSLYRPLITPDKRGSLVKAPVVLSPKQKFSRIETQGESRHRWVGAESPLAISPRTSLKNPPATRDKDALEATSLGTLGLWPWAKIRRARQNLRQHSHPGLCTP